MTFGPHSETVSQEQWQEQGSEHPRSVLGEGNNMQYI